MGNGLSDRRSAGANVGELIDWANSQLDMNFISLKLSPKLQLQLCCDPVHSTNLCTSGNMPIPTGNDVVLYQPFGLSEFVFIYISQHISADIQPRLRLTARKRSTTFSAERLDF